MKIITRSIKLHVYTFAHVDVTNNKLTDSFTVKLPSKITREQSKRISKEHNGVIRVADTIETVKYSLPLEDFLTACENYAERVAAGDAAPVEDGEEYDEYDEI